ncbi:shikimate kinase [Planococcus salinarum]|uniref:shikimate kinase n=1 Tax=Planococcus salinarum TaxID=622695 RepID=UPI00163DA6D2|nr:shikimate kinase [Planococcus salinarum]
MKIHIIGSVGSGKTTLGRKLAQKLEIPHTTTDNLVWQRNPGGDIRNSEERRDELLEGVLAEKGWLIEGVHIGWTDPVIEEASHVIFLDPPFFIRSMRIISRHFKQVWGIEKADYKTEWSMLGKMHRWNKYFEITMKPEFLLKLERYPEKTTVVSRRKDLVNVQAELEAYARKPDN